MGHLSRISVAIGSELLEQFDLLIAGQGYENRSEASRDLIRERLVSQGSCCARPGQSREPSLWSTITTSVFCLRS